MFVTSQTLLAVYVRGEKEERKRLIYPMNKA